MAVILPQFAAFGSSDRKKFQLKQLASLRNNCDRAIFKQQPVLLFGSSIPLTITVNNRGFQGSRRSGDTVRR